MHLSSETGKKIGNWIDKKLSSVPAFIKIICLVTGAAIVIYLGESEDWRPKKVKFSEAPYIPLQSQALGTVCIGDKYWKLAPSEFNGARGKNYIKETDANGNQISCKGTDIATLKDHGAYAFRRLCYENKGYIKIQFARSATVLELNTKC